MRSQFQKIFLQYVKQGIGKHNDKNSSKYVTNITEAST